jgi:hypothetical protein
MSQATIDQRIAVGNEGPESSRRCDDERLDASGIFQMRSCRSRQSLVPMSSRSFNAS